jgi:putative SOS response-associated peptidase YedK
LFSKGKRGSAVQNCTVLKNRRGDGLVTEHDDQRAAPRHREKDRSLFGFAGLWERWRDKASGEVVRSFTIITTTPNEVCAPFHDRMPVIVDPAANYGKWLGEEPTDPVRLLSLLRPFPAEQMEAYAVGVAVGNVKNDEAALLTPIAA